MKPLQLAALMACLMASASVVGIVVRPAPAAASTSPKLVLEDAVPRQFGGWRELPSQTAQVVNPQTQQLLDKLYSQVLTRTYVNADGYRIMLSLAYGDDQRGSLQAHKPEVCYPAQGFALHSSTPAQIVTPYGNIATRQLSTSMGPRKEPVTYWFTMGDTAVSNRFEQRLVQLRFGLTGQIHDGLLFRVSSIDDNPVQAFDQHQVFANALLSAVSVRDRTRLSGLAVTASP
ncbi:MAG TPA: EpsI family protein [Rhizobacter sp.]|nr:EpsI family protein [Rhizobacter sp.]